MKRFFSCLFVLLLILGSSRAQETREIWVPSDALETILKQKPRAVFLTPEQFRALSIDSHRATLAGEKKKLIPPVPAAVRSVAMTGIVQPGADVVAISARYEVECFTDDWTEIPLVLPLTHLGHIEVDEQSALRSTKAPNPVLLTRGKGIHSIKATFHIPVARTPGGESIEIHSPGVAAAELSLQVPDGAKLKSPLPFSIRDNLAVLTIPSQAGGCWKIEWTARKVAAIPGAAIFQTCSYLYTIDSTRLQADLGLILNSSLTELPTAFKITFPEGVRILSVEGSELQGWNRSSGGDLEIKLLPGDRETADLRLRVEEDVPAPGEDSEITLTLPIASISGVHRASGTMTVLGSDDIRIKQIETGPLTMPIPDDIEGSATRLPNYVASFQFPVQKEAPSLSLSRVQDRFNTQLDTLITLKREAIYIERTALYLPIEGTLFEATILPPGDEEIVSIESPGRDDFRWKENNNQLKLRWDPGLSTTTPATVKISTRRDPENWYQLTETPSDLHFESIKIVGTESLSGYVAVAFDPSFQVATGTTEGLAPRDGRNTPVKGNLAWFRLDDFSLDLKPARKPAELSADITAYTLPLANILEIEGQIALDILYSGIRQLVIDTDPATSEFIRFDSPIIAQQERDETTGAWTLTFHEEQSGSAVIRYSMNIPLEVTETEESGGEKKFDITMPRLSIKSAKRIRGDWIIEANTDTELAFTTDGLDAVDSLRVPKVAGYEPRHRIIAAFQYRGDEWKLGLSGTRHPHSDLVSTVIDRLEIDTIVSTDGTDRHQARIAVRSAGDQFLEIKMPKQSVLWSLTIDGERTKPVRSGRDQVRVQLPAHEDSRQAIEINIIYQTPGQTWDGSGREKLMPITVSDAIPVMESYWRLHLPEGFDYQRFKTNLKQDFSINERILLGHVAGKIWDRRKRPGDALTFRESRKQESLSLLTNDELRLNYYDVARDQTRSTFLREIAEDWELPVRVDNYMPLISPGSNSSSREISRNEKKLKDIIIPSVVFSETPLRDALQFLQQKSVELDSSEPEINQKGVNIILSASPSPSPAQGGFGFETGKPAAESSGVNNTPITLRLTNVPLGEALRYTASLAQLKFKVEDHAVVIVPLSTPDADLFTNQYIVPPTFLSGGGGAGGGAAAADPFAPDSTANGPAVSRMTVKQILENAGISFPPGSTAIYNPTTSTLIVKNAPDQMDLVEAYIESIKSGPPDTLGSVFRLPIESKAIETDSSIAEIEEKLRTTILPSLEFKNTPLKDAIAYLSQELVELDVLDSNLNLSVGSGRGTTPPAGGGEGFGFEGGGGDKTFGNGEGVGNTPITLKLTNVSIGEALRYTVNLAQLKYRVEPHGITIIPLSSPDLNLTSVKYSISPEIYKKLITADHFPGGDPFGVTPQPKGPVSPKEAMENAGIVFPPGAAVEFDQNTGMLSIINTPDQKDLVEAYLSSLDEGRSIVQLTSRKTAPQEPDFAPPFIGVLPATGRLFRSIGSVPEVEDLFKTGEVTVTENRRKLEETMIEGVDFKGKTVEEAAQLLEAKLRVVPSGQAHAAGPLEIELDLEEKTPELPAKKLDFSIAKATVLEVLDKIVGESDTRYFVTRSGVVIADRSAEFLPMETVFIPLPAKVFQSVNDDGSIHDHHARNVLKAAGIAFPRGSSAAYNPATGRLAVRNTKANLEAVIHQYAADMKAVAQNPDAPENDLRFSSDFLGGASDLKGFTIGDIGRLPIAFELPKSGRMYQFRGLYAPDGIGFRYVDWERQIRSAWGWILVGLLGFLFGAWRAARMPLFLGIFTVVLLTFLPMVITDGIAPLCNSLLLGWLAGMISWMVYLLVRKLSPGEKDWKLPRASELSKAWRLFFLIAIGFGVTSRDVSADDKKPVEPPTVYVPYDPEKPLSEQKAERYYIDKETFEGLWKQVKEYRLQMTNPPKTTVQTGYTLSTALYRMTSAPERLSVLGRLSVTTQGKDWQRVPLNFAGANLSEILLDGKAASFQNGAILIEIAGNHLVEVKFELPFEEGQDSADFTIPKSTGVLLEISMESDLAEPVLQKGWPIAKSKQEGNQTLYTAAIGQQDKISFRRRLKTSGRSMTRPNSAIIDAQLFVAQGLEQLEAAYRLNFEGQEDNRFSISFEKTFTPVSFDIPNLSTWEIEDKPGTNLRMMTFFLTQPVRDSLEMKFTGERLTEAAQRQFPELSAEAGRIEQRRGLFRAAGLAIQPRAGTNHRQIAATENSSGFYPVSAFSLTGANETLNYTVSEKRAKRSAEVSYVYQLGAGKMETIAQFQVRSPEEPLLRVAISIPTGAKIQRIVGNRIKDWWRTDDELFVRFSGATPEITAMLVYLTQNVNDNADSFTLPIASFPIAGFNDDEVTGEGLIVAHTTRDISLKFSGNPSVIREVGTDEVAKEFEILPPMARKRGFRFEKMNFRGEMASAKLAPRYNALWVALARVHDSWVQLSIHTDIEVSRSGLDRVSFQTTTEMPEFRIPGDDIREIRITEADGVRNYEVIFQQFVIDGISFTMETELPHSGAATLPDIQIPGADRQERFLIVENLSTERMTLDPKNLDSTVMSALPYKPATLVSAQLFRARPAWSLGISLENLETSAGNEAVILYAELTSAFRTSGEEWLKAEYHLQNRSLQFLPVAIPEGAELVSVVVAGSEVRADRGKLEGQDVILVPLIQTRPGQLAYDVKLVFRSRGKAIAIGKRLKRTLDDPAVFGPTVEKTIWKVHLPEGHQLSGFDGNMQPIDEEESNLRKLQSDLSELKGLNWLSTQIGNDTQVQADSNRNAQVLAERIEKKMEQVGKSEQAQELGLLKKELDQQKVVITENRIEMPIFNQSGDVKILQGGEPSQGVSWIDNSGEIKARNLNYFDVAKNQSERLESQLRVNDNISLGNQFFNNYQTMPEKKLESESEPVAGSKRMEQIGHLSQNPKMAEVQEKLSVLNNSQKLEQVEGFSKKRKAAKPAIEAKDQPSVQAYSNARSAFKQIGHGGDREMGQANAAPAQAQQAAAPDQRGLGDGLNRVQSETQQGTVGDEAAFGNTFKAAGRRSVSVDFPVEGEAFYFQKLKDHAQLEILSKENRDSGRIASFFGMLALLGLVVVGKVYFETRKRESLSSRNRTS